MVARAKKAHVEPIPTKERKNWNALIKRTIEIVDARDDAQWKLILIAGEIEVKYGEHRLQRWAEESGMEYSTARQYQWLAKKGVDQEFIDKWARTSGNRNGLTYSVVRAVAGFAGSVTSDYALEYLQWALDHKASKIAVEAYMRELVAPHDGRETAAKEIKMALQDKQEREGFSDYVRIALEEMVDKNPKAMDTMLNTVITNVDDLKALEVAAGIVSDEEREIVEESLRFIRKVDAMRKWFKENEKAISENISYGHERSEELRDTVGYLKAKVDPIVETKPTNTFQAKKGRVKEIDLAADAVKV
jgi:hypothetical protein